MTLDKDRDLESEMENMETRVIMGCCIFVAVFSPFLLWALSSLEIRQLDFLNNTTWAQQASVVDEKF